MTAVYIETTIPSFFHTARKDMRSAARQRWTREWWKVIGPGFELHSSDAAIAELQHGTLEDLKTLRIELISGLNLLDWSHRSCQYRTRLVNAVTDDAAQLP